MTTVAQDYANYMQSMMDGDWQASLLIEQRHGLDGYPPEIVTFVAALRNGETRVRQCRNRRTSRDQVRPWKSGNQ